MRKLLSILFVMVAMVAMVSAADRATQGFVPENADLDHYPIADKPLSMERIAELGLTPMHLDDYLANSGTDSLVVFNHYRKLDRWVLETLNPAKYRREMLLVDQTGEPRYLQYCGNRIAIKKIVAKMGITEHVSVLATDEQLPAPNPFTDIPWHVLGWLFWLLLLLLLLWALLTLLRGFWRWLDHRDDPRPRRRTRDEMLDIDDVPAGTQRPTSRAATHEGPTAPIGAATAAAAADTTDTESEPVGTVVPLVRPGRSQVSLTFKGKFEITQQDDGNTIIQVSPR